MDHKGKGKIRVWKRMHVLSRRGHLIFQMMLVLGKMHLDIPLECNKVRCCGIKIFTELGIR